MTLGHPGAKENYTYLYDNEGIIRGMIPIEDYRIDRLILENNSMYLNINNKKIARLNRVGYVEKIYDIGEYTAHHDQIYTNNEHNYIYNSPKLDYIICHENFWEGTGYDGYLLKANQSFTIQGGQHAINIKKDDYMNSKEYYLYFFNNNTGVSSTRPNYKWTDIEENNETSMYYKYLIEENNNTFSFKKEFNVEKSQYLSSAQEYYNNIIICSGMKFISDEFDNDGKLIKKFMLPKDGVAVYRVFKYSFDNFYNEK